MSWRLRRVISKHDGNCCAEYVWHGYKLPVPFVCWEMVDNVNTFFSKVSFNMTTIKTWYFSYRCGSRSSDCNWGASVGFLSNIRQLPQVSVYIYIYIYYNSHVCVWLKFRQNDRHIAGHFKFISWNENYFIWIKISLQFNHKDPIYNNPTRIQFTIIQHQYS